MPFEKDARRPIDMIPILDGWIDVVREMIASRSSAVAWQPGATPMNCTLQPLPDLLCILQLMREHRDQLLREAGYAVVSGSRLPQVASCALSRSEQQFGEFIHHAR